MSPPPEHLLLYEPRIEGHHLSWLRYITEDLLSAGYRLSLAVDLRESALARVQSQLAGLGSELKLFSAYDRRGRRHLDGKSRSVDFCLQQSGAARVFLCALDEIASPCWRRAAFGWFPPRGLRGRMGGIYHRPRFMAAPAWSPNRMLKQLGFRRLMQGGWLQPLLFVDEYLTRARLAEFPGSPIHFLPPPCPTGYGGEGGGARRKLGVPLDKKVFLFYGTGHRRKGLHLAVEAMRGLEPDSGAFLLCVGQLNPRGQTASGLKQLEEAGRGRLINRYVSTEEEKLSFAACDAVLVPYVHHFGTSAVLFQAMAARKMVIASDEELVGRLVREHGLGLLFETNETAALRERIRTAVALTPEEEASFQASTGRFAQNYSREAYRQALLQAIGEGHRNPQPHS
jgi:glycosyltransferase involved in cell wall biosynthesis